MNPEQEALLKAFDAYKQAEGFQAKRLWADCQARLEIVAQTTRFRREVLDRAVRRYHRRWVRANLPQGFPKRLGET